MDTQTGNSGTLDTIPEVKLKMDSLVCQINPFCLRKGNVMVVVSHLRDKLLQGGGEGETESATPPSPSPLCGWTAPAPPGCWGSGTWRSRWLCRRIVWSFSRTIRRSVWTWEFALAYTSCTQHKSYIRQKQLSLAVTQPFYTFGHLSFIASTTAKKRWSGFWPECGPAPYWFAWVAFLVQQSSALLHFPRQAVAQTSVDGDSDRVQVTWAWEIPCTFTTLYYRNYRWSIWNAEISCWSKSAEITCSWSDFRCHRNTNPCRWHNMLHCKEELELVPFEHTS